MRAGAHYQIDYELALFELLGTEWADSRDNMLLESIRVDVEILRGQV
jgi:hypothetical protein